MLGLFKRKKNNARIETEVVAQDKQPPVTPKIETPTPPPKKVQLQEKPQPKKKGFFKRLTSGLSKTRQGLASGMGSALLGKKTIDDELIEEIETQLLMADIGVEATQAFIANLTKQLSRKKLQDPEAVLQTLRDDMCALLKTVERPLDTETQQPFVILMTGVNGAGKTTTIGKLAKRFQNEGKTVMLAAGDTFRAAAIEQLQVWGKRNNIPVIAQQSGADSAAVIFDAISAAKARNIDVLIADTAGRLHTQDNLMEELRKIKRVIQKVDDSAPHEILTVLDAGNGQNALNQAEQFNKAVDVTGICLTKLDGTAKGGIIFALAKKLSIPIRFIGVGEQIDDLREFNAEEFTDALFSDDT